MFITVKDPILKFVIAYVYSELADVPFATVGRELS